MKSDMVRRSCGNPPFVKSAKAWGRMTYSKAVMQAGAEAKVVCGLTGKGCNEWWLSGQDSGKCWPWVLKEKHVAKVPTHSPVACRIILHDAAKVESTLGKAIKSGETKRGRNRKQRLAKDV